MTARRSAASYPRVQIAVLLALLATACQQVEETPTQLAVGEEVAFELAPSAQRRFRLTAVAGDFIRLTAEQDEIDVVIRLFAPSGEEVVDADCFYGDSGPDPLLALAEQDGEYAVEIQADEQLRLPGRITLRLDTVRPAAETDRLAAERFRTLRQAVALIDAARLEEAIPLYQRVIAGSASAGDSDLWSAATVRLASVHLRLGELEKAREHLRRVAAAQALDRPLWQIKALDTLAYLDVNTGRPGRSIQSTVAALAMPEVERSPFRQARLYSFLGQARQAQGAIQPALDAYRRALALYRPWDGSNRARVLQNLGALHRQSLGLPRLALDFLEQAAAAFRALGDDNSLATALNQTGASLEALGEPERAAAAYREALEIRRALEDSCAEANTQIRLASLALAAGRSEEADERASAARAIAEGERCVLDRQAIWPRLALFAERRGNLETARDDFRRSLVDARDTGNRDVEVDALVGLARTCRPAGACAEDPLTLTSDALAIIEDTRSGLAQENHRLSFGSRTQALFDVRIDLQWERGDFSAAFETAEKARARALLDRLRQIDANVGAGAHGEKLEEARQLRYALRVKEAERLERAYKGGLSSAQQASQRAAIDALVAQLNEVEAEIGRRHPAYFQLMRAEPAGLAAVQALLDPQTVLLAYRLGEARSYLWLVTEAAVHSFELPARAVIEAEAHRSRDRLRSGSPAWSARGLESLVTQILPPEALPHLSARRRWRVVADGVLELLPFAALPDPAAGAEPRPLLVDHEVVHLPSASVWVELRARPARPAAQGWLALVADPVYSSDDERLASAVRSAADPLAGDFRRLPGSGREAEAILALLPPDAKYAFYSGLQATRESVLGGALHGHRVVHLSVHGEIHPHQPALSYLALAARDAAGQPVAGQLFAHELYDLDLPAELVVLAGCETGIGPLIPGEGLVSGLSRGFLYAGARWVMVSLWPIPDTETPQLMTSFYTRLFAGDDAVQALHAAQRALYRSGAPPHVWAGFVLQGD